MLEALPVGAARIVDVDVGVDEARQDQQVARILDRDADAVAVPIENGSDAAVLDRDRCRTHAVGQEHSLTANEECVHEEPVRVCSVGERVSRRRAASRTPRDSS